MHDDYQRRRRARFAADLDMFHGPTIMRVMRHGAIGHVCESCWTPCDSFFRLAIMHSCVWCGGSTFRPNVAVQIDTPLRSNERPMDLVPPSWRSSGLNHPGAPR